MSRSFSDVQNAYNKIKGTKVRYGVYHKSLFHIHTPQSYDYKLKKSWTADMYKSIPTSTVVQLCKDNKILPEGFNLDDFELNGELSVYKSKKEWLSFILLAEELINNDIEIAVVSDHNTIQGIDKLRVAIKHLHKMKQRKVYPEIISSLEISCADRVHVVVLFNDSHETKRQISEWLSESLLNEEDGTFRTSLEVMDYFNNIGCIPYIAHINSSYIYNEKKYLSGGYKAKLLGSKYLSMVGISDYNQRNKINKFLYQFQKRDINFIIDSDIHDIDSVNEKYFWLKGSQIDFNMIQEALLDFDISVSYKKEPRLKQNIIGMYVEQGGFLNNKDKDEGFCIRFSESLNCFIGGRGTGKSTVLHLIDFILGQRCGSIELLDFICNHGNTWILYEYEKTEYLIEMAMPNKTRYDDNIMRCFGQNAEDRYNYRYQFDTAQVESIARDLYLSIFIVKEKNGMVFFETAPNKKKLLELLYDSRYSVNELVSTASGVEINDFIYNMMFKNKMVSSPEKLISIRKKSGLLTLIKDINIILENRKKEVIEVIDSFNATQNNILKINYSQDECAKDPDVKNWLFFNDYSAKNYYKHYNITEQNIVDFILGIYYEVGIFELLKLSIDADYYEKRRDYSLTEYSIELTQDMINSDIQELNNLNELAIINEIFDNLVTEGNVKKIIDYLKKYIHQIEQFSLLFNINSNESNRGNSLNFKDVRKLSLGQKVVAMLDFILGYSDYAEDYRPLLIDQPEDNLDSQYIYKNLVFQLRKAKTTRQIIIATHNATIVTNAMADQVCVMKSDGEFGWVEALGYPSEKKIKINILNYLEGGIDSFKHKKSIYQDILE
ncbi:Spaf_1101 family AAA-like ATPase [Tissierella sp.]|uniref:Spaf_1101 family AAA-like ATPase n=1 Tax=Tissierella sp. TaxID=41274 RepID=UPI00285975CC|nr:hypothetical protein [Tissierella sp.]MDR7855743.1 hypothetical protein [Tissierella sp.]